jgi:hypothetical protein
MFGLLCASAALREVCMMLVLMTLVACEKHDHPASTSGGGHHHAAPHGGTLVELGEEAAHLELLVDRKTGKLTAYVLDGEAENAVRIAQPTIVLNLAPGPVELKGVASGLTGEKVGDTSQFEATHEAFKQPVIEGKVANVTVKGATFKDVAFSVK